MAASSVSVMSTRKSGRGLLALVAMLASCLALRSFFVAPGAPPRAMATAVPAPREVLEKLFSGMLETDVWVAGLLVVLVCYRLCEVSKVPPHTVTPFDKRADTDRLTFMNAYLALMSGMVNAVAFIEMGMTVSHMTGNTTHTGRTWGTTGMKFLQIIIAFMVGSGVVGAHNVDTEAWIKRRHSGPLMASAVAVASAMIVKDAMGSTKMSLLLLAFSQGILNAITRKCTAMPICVSHITGYATDAGSILGAWMKANMNKEDPPSLKKPAIFIVSMITFALGGYLSTLLVPRLGVTTLALPAAGTALAAAGFI